MTSTPSKSNLLAELPTNLGHEAVEDIIRTEHVRIERIVSRGHSTPKGEWYDQEEHEWVMVLAGCGTLRFEDGSTLELGPGDYANIPAHCRHRVESTTLDRATVWLAAFYK